MTTIRSRPPEASTRTNPFVRPASGVPCACTHEGVPCPDPAVHRVVLLCRAEECDYAARHYLACAPCTASWLRQAAGDPNGPRLRVEPL